MVRDFGENSPLSIEGMLQQYPDLSVVRNVMGWVDIYSAKAQVESSVYWFHNQLLGQPPELRINGRRLNREPSGGGDDSTRISIRQGDETFAVDYPAEEKERVDYPSLLQQTRDGLEFFDAFATHATTAEKKAYQAWIVDQIPEEAIEEDDRLTRLFEQQVDPQLGAFRRALGVDFRSARSHAKLALFVVRNFPTLPPPTITIRKE